MAHSRVDYLDTIGGMLIIIMIFSHIEAKYWQSDFKLTGIINFFNFFMPWFFYKSGMFYRRRTMNELFHKGIKKLMVPYVSFFILAIPLFFMELLLRHDFNWMHYVLSPFKALLLQQALDTNSPIWFLLSLFVVQILYNFLNIKLGGDRFYLALCLLIALFVAYALNFFHISKPFVLANVCTGLFFYGMGDLLKLMDSLSFWFGWIVFGLVYSCFFVIYPSQLSMYMNQLIEGNYLLWAVMSLLGICCMNGGVKHIKFKIFLSSVGKNSMSYYLLHYPILVIIYFICHDFLLLSDTYTYLLTVLILVMLLPLLDRFIRKTKYKWILGI